MELAKAHGLVGLTSMLRKVAANFLRAVDCFDGRRKDDQLELSID